MYLSYTYMVLQVYYNANYIYDTFYNSFYNLMTLWKVLIHGLALSDP